MPKATKFVWDSTVFVSNAIFLAIIVTIIVILALNWEKVFQIYQSIAGINFNDLINDIDEINQKLDQLLAAQP